MAVHVAISAAVSGRGTEGGGIMSFHVSERRRDATFLGGGALVGNEGGTKGNRSEVRQKNPERNKEGKSQRPGEREES